MSASSLKRPPPPTHQSDPYAQYQDLVYQVVDKYNNLEDSDCNLAARQLYMRFHRVKAAAKVQIFFLKVHQSRQIGTLLKAHMCALAPDMPAVSQALHDWLKFMRSTGTQGTPQAEKHMGELKTMWQSIPKGADWAISATTLSYSLHSDESARLQLITVQNAAQWWNAVIRNLAVTPDPNDFTIIREELESLGAKSSTKTRDWINQWVVAEEEDPRTSMQTPSALGQRSIQNYQAQNTTAHSSTANPHLQTPHNHPQPMPFPNQSPYQRAQEHRTTLLPFPPP